MNTTKGRKHLGLGGTGYGHEWATPARSAERVLVVAYPLHPRFSPIASARGREGAGARAKGSVPAPATLVPAPAFSPGSAPGASRQSAAAARRPSQTPPARSPHRRSRRPSTPPLRRRRLGSTEKVKARALRTLVLRGPAGSLALVLRAGR
eukprot:355020-Chlamydomonas_euryale.AAC.1